jgi:glycosyltransferase involved in cell wall biosynthesis
LNPRIWIVNQFANTPQLPGHIRQYELGKFLSERECSVTVFSSDYNLTKREYLKLKSPQLWQQETFDKLCWYWLYVTPYKTNNWRRYLNMLSFCISLFLIGIFQPKPDLIIGSSPQILAALTAWILAKIKGAKFYFEVRDLWPQTLIDVGGQSPDSLLVKLIGKIEKWLYEHSDRVIVLAKGSVDYVSKRGATEVIWLPNGPDIEDFIIDISPQKAKYLHNIPEDRFCLMYTGAHGDANALEAVVEAARKLDTIYPNTFLIILVGDGPEKANLIKQGSNISSLEFRDPIPKREIPELLKAADGLIITLKDVPLFRYGVSPNKLYDYYAAGKPVIVGVGGSINQEVEEHQLGFTAEPEDSDGIAKSILKLYSTSSTEREAMGQRGQSLVVNTYSRIAVANKLWNLIQQEP